MLWLLAAVAVLGGFYGVFAFGLSRSMLFLGQLCKGHVPFAVRASATLGVVGSAGVIYGGLLLPFATNYNDCIVLGLGILIASLSGLVYLLSMKRWTSTIEKEMKTQCSIQTK